MKYFKICQEKRGSYGILLKDLNSIGGYKESQKGDMSKLDNSMVLLIDPGSADFYADILDRQLFMIKNAVKEVFDLFLPELEYKHCCLIDSASEKYEQYHIPVLEVLDTQTASTENKHIFRLIDTKETAVMASLEVVEALLRRNPVGVRFSIV